MTAYGSAEKLIGDLQCSLEIKTLNGKQFDVYAKIPQSLKSIETQLRQLIRDQLQRGSVELIINLKQFGESKPVGINKELAVFYRETIRDLSEELELTSDFSLDTILRLPEVISTGNVVLSDDDLAAITSLCKNVCDIVNQERAKEGMMLATSLQQNIAAIQASASAIVPLEKERIAQKKEKITTQLKEFMADENFDPNRLEQEMIYYIEKLDISEEQTRLAHHCEYFLEQLQNDVIMKGKKLGFICQEIGREINTLGAKANDATIQKYVVAMKDELEQAKEQIANVL